jgi:hypothetical protein
MIDHTLKERGKLHLVYNQPLRLVEGKSKASISAKRTKSHDQVPPMRLSSSYPTTNPHPQRLPREVSYGDVPSSSSKSSAGNKPLETPAPLLTSLKRPSDALNSVKKKQKTASYPGCAVCGGPHHLVKDCPVTTAGPKRYCHSCVDLTALTFASWVTDSVHEAILRLESQSGQSATVAALREVLRKHERRALGLAHRKGIQR